MYDGTSEGDAEGLLDAEISVWSRYCIDMDSEHDTSGQTNLSLYR